MQQDKRQNQIKINESLLNGTNLELKEIYKNILKEAEDTRSGDVSLASQKQTSAPITDITRDRTMLAANAPTYRDISLGSVQELGNGWWKINGKIFYIPPTWIPVGFNEHGILIIVPVGAPKPEMKPPLDRYDDFPSNPKEGDVTQIRGVDGRYHFYIFHAGPPARWVFVQGYWYQQQGNPGNPNQDPNMVYPSFYSFQDGNTEEWGEANPRPWPGQNPNFPQWPGYPIANPPLLTPGQLQYPPINPNDPYSPLQLPAGAGYPESWNPNFIGPPNPWWFDTDLGDYDPRFNGPMSSF